MIYVLRKPYRDHSTREELVNHNIIVCYGQMTTQALTTLKMPTDKRKIRKMIIIMLPLLPFQVKVGNFAYKRKQLWIKI